ncbi:hypothetical protein LUZ63_003135 [Rhynchospora breviuscula]|uniref:Ubiquitin-like protease family profile domain-containing protein n=1 Tax=Rhynchospora breviuscula TaxID=2022672 RepID=A0A9Q0D057_9POAL|nr:hypothetical protein LUZ63_003135 [Rhynchospora breviuscula]
MAETSAAVGKSSIEGIDLSGKFAMMTKALSPPQRAQIMEFGFGGTLTLHPMLISRQLIVDMVKVYNPLSQCFKMGEMDVPITTQDVWCIMGLRDEGTKIDIEMRMPKHELIRIFEDPSQKQITFNSLMDRILRTDPCDPNFIRMFVILLVAGVLAPPQSEVIPYEYLNKVEDIPLIKKINWADFTVKILLSGLKRNVVDKERLQGSLIFIQMADDDEGIHCHPLMAKWDGERLQKREDFHREKGRFGGKIIVQLKCNEEKGKRVLDVLSDSSDEVQVLHVNTWTRKPETKRAKRSESQDTVTPDKIMETNTSNSNELSDESDPEGDKNDFGLSSEEMAAVNYVEHAALNKNLVSNDARGMYLTARQMKSLSVDPKERGAVKWVHDEVINCFIETLDKDRHPPHKVMAVSSYLTNKYSDPYIKDTKYPRDIKNFTAAGKNFLNHDMRNGIQFCISLALKDDLELSTMYGSLDITNWPVEEIKAAPKQQDDSSCGLFVMKFIELWNGTIETTKFPKVVIY